MPAGKKYSIFDETLILFNAWSIHNKWPDIKCQLQFYSPSVIVIVETWIYEHVNKYYTLEDYQSSSTCGKNNYDIGVMLLLKSCFSAVMVIPEVQLRTSRELLLVQDMTNNSCWMLVYRPPNIQVADTIMLLETIESALNDHANIVLQDFNFPSINWLTLTAECGISNALSNNFNYLCASYDFYQIVPEPTIYEHYLDFILTSMPDRF